MSFNHLRVVNLNPGVETDIPLTPKIAHEMVKQDTIRNAPNFQWRRRRRANWYKLREEIDLMEEKKRLSLVKEVRPRPPSGIFVMEPKTITPLQKTKLNYKRIFKLLRRARESAFVTNKEIERREDFNFLKVTSSKNIINRELLDQSIYNAVMNPVTYNMSVEDTLMAYRNWIWPVKERIAKQTQKINQECERTVNLFSNRIYRWKLSQIMELMKLDDEAKREEALKSQEQDVNKISEEIENAVNKN
ncbi:hypothetical protein O9G_005012 [Rozella allomycis CSF55]|uniref:Uncharacterized protein n=1 Tax=Rozella allomycis (strain CSF55) TaxID=988480 RepID=A0A075AYT9_ROZAC|nr:hypothetical protein O9G_005012 [Rozella allomycis CSF55]|eukprot:EPZ35475.1 hypothetical protein O9G_005012 [Rozella allomycis CSF55]